MLDFVDSNAAATSSTMREAAPILIQSPAFSFSHIVTNTNMGVPGLYDVRTCLSDERGESDDVVLGLGANRSCCLA